MSKKQKVVKKNEKKGLKPQTKRNLINVFKSLISNQAAIDGAKEAPFWIAIIFLVLSMCLPVIPIIVAQQKTYGSSFISTYSYNADRGLANTTRQLEDQGYKFSISNNLLTFNKTIDDDSTPVATDKIKKFDTDGVTTYEYYNFLFYITNRTGSDLNTYATKLSEKQFLEKSTDLYTPEAEKAGKDYYKASFIIVSPETLYVSLYKAESHDVAGASPSGLNWLNSSCDDLLTRVDNDQTLLESSTARRDNIYNNWKSVFNETFIYRRNINTRNYSLIYLGVYAGLIIFLGLMIFLLTRGRNNAFNYLKWYTCQFISWWASFTPAVLGMILGFLFSTNMIGQMAFIVLVSIRIMWLSMRQLRPIQ